MLVGSRRNEGLRIELRMLPQHFHSLVERRKKGKAGNTQKNNETGKISVLMPFVTAQLSIEECALLNKLNESLINRLSLAVPSVRKFMIITGNCQCAAKLPFIDFPLFFGD